MTTKHQIVTTDRICHVWVDLEAFCGGYDVLFEPVYGLIYAGKTLYFQDYRGVTNRSLNPNYKDPQLSFMLPRFLKEMGVRLRIYSTISPHGDTRQDFLSGILYQLAGDGIECCTQGQAGAVLMFELDEKLYPHFRRRLRKLLAKLRSITFITVDPSS